MTALVRQTPSIQEAVTREEAEAAVRTLIIWLGDDPAREGLIDTPKRVVDAYKDWFSGYEQNPENILSRRFEDVENYDDLILLRGVRVESYCEHHMAPIIGVAHIAYLPDKEVVGISKLARLVDMYAKRLQVQEKLTAQVTNAIEDYLKPRGTAVMIEAEHQCMSTRGVRKKDVDTVTTRFTGLFADDEVLHSRFLNLVRG